MQSTLRVKMKLLLVLSNFLFIFFVCVFADYEHNYGKGHGGGHGFYGYPVGRKWGYSTYIKHPPPKHHGGYGGHDYKNYGYGGPGYGHQGYEFGPSYRHGHWPTRNGYGGGFGQGYSPTYGQSYPAYSHTYRRQYIPFEAYDFDRKRREDIHGGHNQNYNSYGQHKNHNYGGDTKGFNTRNSEFEEFPEIDSLLGKYGTKI